MDRVLGQPSRVPDAELRRGEALVGPSLRSLLLVGAFGDLPQRARAHAAVQQRMWRGMDEMKKAGYARYIDIGSNRAGTIPGTHEIGFDSGADTITLRHTARSREGFARGALKAAQWIVGKKGFYEFSEIEF